MARHESGDEDATEALLARLERFREELGRSFDVLPDGVAVVVHPRATQLALAQPWLPLARLASAPAGRRYLAGWFTERQIHVLGPQALEGRASGVPGSREALALAPLHEYAHLVVAANNRSLPPPFNPRSLQRYLRWAWLCEGAACHLSGQTQHLQPAIARRLREGARPAFPPRIADAQLLGGTLLGLLEQGQGRAACVALVSQLDRDGHRRALERAFDAPASDIEAAWRRHIASFSTA